MKTTSNSRKTLFNAGCIPSLVAIAAVLLMTLSTVWATPPTPLLEYTFDDGPGAIPAADSGVAPQTNGIFSGNATRNTTTPNGTGYDLDLTTAGVNDYVTCGDPAKLNNSMTLSNAVTLTCWLYLQANPVAKDRIMSKISTTGGFDLYINNATATGVVLDFNVNTTSGGCFSSAINMSQWVFVAVTYNAALTSNNVAFYTGGTNTATTLLNTTSLADGLIKNSGLGFRVGSTAASASDRTPSAWFDDVRIYDSVLAPADLETVRAQGGFPSPLSFLVSPVSQTVYPYPATTNVTFSVIPSSTPDYLQWFYNGTNAANAISGATNTSLTLLNPTAATAGTYYVIASNSTGVAVGSGALTMVVLNSGRLSNIWNLLPGSQPYISVTNNANFERGLAYDAYPAVGTSGDLLLMSLATTNLVVLDATNGVEKYVMNLAGNIPNTIAVAADGTVYGANVTANAATTSYGIFQWPADDSVSSPGSAFFGDPGGSTAPGLRWGDNLAVQGAGIGTKILCAPGSGTNICLFNTPDGVNFNANIITVSNVPSGFAQFGIAFGPQPNTFWAKTRGSQLYLVQYNTNTWVGAPIYTASYAVPSLFRIISTDSQQQWMAGITTLSSAQPDLVSLFDISSLAADPVWVDGASYATTNRSSFLNGDGTGVTVFGNNNGNEYLFALDSNNGIMAFLVTTNLLAYNITSFQPLTGGNVALTWQSISNHTYQVQSSTNLSSGNWLNLGSPISASGPQTSATNAVSQPAQFFRVSGQ